MTKSALCIVVFFPALASAGWYWCLLNSPPVILALVAGI
jgi:hypothetical protein